MQMLFHFIRWMTALGRFGERANDETYREEFEREAVRSGKFKMVRYTRGPDGKYDDERLEKEWQDYLADAKLTDSAW